MKTNNIYNICWKKASCHHLFFCISMCMYLCFCAILVQKCKKTRVPEAIFWFLFRWRFLGWMSFCQLWRRWAAPSYTRSPTPRLLNAFLVCWTRNHRVSLGQNLAFSSKNWEPHVIIESSVTVWFLLQVILWTAGFTVRWRGSAVSWTLRLHQFTLRPSPSWSG